MPSIPKGVENKVWNLFTPPRKAPATAIESVCTKLARVRQLFNRQLLHGISWNSGNRFGRRY